MAFDRTPSQSTYQTKILPLVKEMNSRGSDTTKDEDFLNLYPELIKNRTTKEDVFKLIKRDGSSSFISLAGNARGGHYWKDENKLLVAVSDDVYVYNATTGALIATLSTVFATTTSGPVGFCEFLYDTGAVKIVVTDGTTLSTIDSSNVVVATADADKPVHVPVPIFLDGYLFIIKVDTGDIYNSNLNDPLAFTAGDFITAEMRADRLTHLAVLNNYLVAFGNSSIEYFWDAAVATGSPMQRNDTPIKLTGFLGATAQLGQRLYFVGASGAEAGTSGQSQPNVFVLEDFKITPIGSEALRRHLSAITTTFSTTLKGNIVSMNGHDFYVLDTGTATYALELESGLWVRWAFKTTSRFPINFAFNITTAATYKSLFISETDLAVVGQFLPTLYQDFSVNFSCIVVTDKFTFDTLRNKFMGKLIIWSNRPATAALLSVQWTDNDYTSYNTARTVDLSQERPTLTGLGSFRSRAFKLTFAANHPLLLQIMEADINMGAT